ncbi:MAG TPA: DUF2993 domain-containing protein [Pseudolysinimonas sp.]
MADSGPLIAPKAPKPPRAKRRRIWPFVTIAIVLVVLIAGFFIADAAAKSYAQDRIKQELVSSLGLPPGTEVDVAVGGGSVLLQALSGKLNEVDVAIPKLAFGDLVGSATLHATQVPLDQSRPLDKLAISYTVSEKNVAALATQLSGVKLDSISLKDKQIVAKATLSVLFLTVPIGLGLSPSAQNGQLAFTPTSITVSGQTFTAEQLLANPVFGSIARTLLQQQSFCVAQYLPRAMTLTSARVGGANLVLDFSGDGAAIGGSAFTTKGRCS